MIRQVSAFLRNIFRKELADQDLDDEIRSYHPLSALWRAGEISLSLRSKYSLFAPHRGFPTQNCRYLVFPDFLDEISYDDRHITRQVRENGTIRWKSKEIFVTEVLRRERIGLLPTPARTFEVYFGKSASEFSTAARRHSTRTMHV